MIPVNKTVAVTEHGFEGFERAEFTIAVTKESFRVLIDSLYTHKERAVIRELWTNAYDAQIEAGFDGPFDCHLPDLHDATFWVRDYGVSMDHETVMHLYTSVFTSTKTNSNTQVGQLGLGSKSPQAYTDSYEVETYLDGMKRTYLASLSPEGIPTITFLLAEETDEPNGVKVSFAVQTRHFNEFAREAADLAKAFPVPPRILGQQINVVQPTITFENWKWYSDLGCRVLVQQGCVQYPLDTPCGLVRSGTMVVEVPIGSVGVAASREALSMDDTTQSYIKRMLVELEDSLGRYVTEAMKDAHTFLDAVATAAQVNGNFSLKVGTWHGRPIPVDGRVDLTDGGMFDLIQPYKTGREIKEGKAHGVNKLFNELQWVVFYVDRGQRIPRRKMRLDAMSWTNSFILKHPTNKQLKHLIRKFNLKPHQVRSLTTIPDVQTKRMATGLLRTGVYQAVGHDLQMCAVDFDELDEFYIIPIEKMTENIFFRKLQQWMSPRTPYAVYQLSNALDFPKDSVYFVLPNVLKRLDPTVLLWEDDVVGRLTVLKDELLRQYEDQHRHSYVPAQALQPYLDTGLLPQKTYQNKYHPALHSQWALNLFQDDIKAICDRLEAEGKALHAKYPLLSFIDTWRTRQAACPHMIDYINLINEKDNLI